MRRKNAELCRYCREVRSWLPCTRKAKRKIMDKIENVISESEGELTYGQLVERFGTPQQIASAYVDEMGTMELLNDLRIKRKIVRAVAVSCVIALVMWASCIAVALMHDYDQDNGYMVETLIVGERTKIE